MMMIMMMMMMVLMILMLMILMMMPLLQGRIDLFFFLLGGFMLANLAVFVAVAVRYQYKQVRRCACLNHTVPLRQSVEHVPRCHAHNVRMCVFMCSTCPLALVYLVRMPLRRLSIYRSMHGWVQ